MSHKNLSKVLYEINQLWYNKVIEYIQLCISHLYSNEYVQMIKFYCTKNIFITIFLLKPLHLITFISLSKLLQKKKLFKFL